MRFNGRTFSQQEESRRLWVAWLETPGRDPRERRFALHFVKLMEERVGRQHIEHLAAAGVRAVNKNELGGRPLSAEQFKDVLLALLQSWEFGTSLRNWAVNQGYLNENDR